MLVPIKALLDSLIIFHDELEIYPIWLCPMKIPTSPRQHWPAVDSLTVESLDVFERQPTGFVSPIKGDDLYVDIGAYGVPKAAQWAQVVEEVYGRKLQFDERVKSPSDFSDVYEPTKVSPGPFKALGEGVVDDITSVDLKLPLHQRVMRKVIHAAGFPTQQLRSTDWRLCPSPTRIPSPLCRVFSDARRIPSNVWPSFVRPIAREVRLCWSTAWSVWEGGTSR